MDTYVLFLREKRVTVRPEDLKTEKIAVIFQVQKDTIYLTDDHNIAIFPEENGHFISVDLVDRGHYEVHGDASASAAAAPPPPPPPATATAAAADQRPRFAFQRPVASAVARTKAFQRNIYIGEVMEGRLQTSKTVTVRFSEFEANVPSILGKVVEALGDAEEMILTDVQGNAILDSEGTRGSNFWKQNSRKTFAVPEIQLGQLGKRRRLSRREDTGLQDVVAEIEEVIEAAQGLKEVTKSIKEVTEGTGKATLLCLQDGEVNALKTVFGCLVCPGPVEKPIFSSCCRSIIGCRSCIQQWEHSHDYCPKCRCQDRETNEVAGLDEALAVLRKLF
ncbi:hypothetical protein PBY51_020922 [Eleginops maclovinus]|uniref:RING-type domain-containing protein n=1 Tax=Eleginops maclovinus TaxID=56733 RepID=A0AAN7XGN3_ELEMC|nr:hypothetical protein PBY51_020922 [Eleginops maclovinus]